MSSRRAFLWGSNANERYTRLRYAKGDARALGDMLATPRYGFSVEVFDDTSDPFAVHRALMKASTACGRADTFIAHFSGHGDIVAGQLHLVLDNSDPDDLSTLFSSTWLMEAFTKCKARHRLLVLDCCHAGAATGARSNGVSVAELLPELQSQLVLHASARLEQARELEEFGGGFLTRTLVRQLAQAPTGAVRLNEVLEHLQLAAEEHNTAQRTVERRVPIPFLWGMQQGDFYFSGSAGSTAISGAAPRTVPEVPRPTLPVGYATHVDTLFKSKRLADKLAPNGSAQVVFGALVTVLGLLWTSMAVGASSESNGAAAVFSSAIAVLGFMLLMRGRNARRRNPTMARAQLSSVDVAGFDVARYLEFVTRPNEGLYLRLSATLEFAGNVPEPSEVEDLLRQFESFATVSREASGIVIHRKESFSYQAFHRWMIELLGKVCRPLADRGYSLSEIHYRDRKPTGD